MRDSTAGLSRRALLVQDVFRHCVAARLEFNAAIGRCAVKGWPDKKAEIEASARVQELMLNQLIVRVNYLVEQRTSAVHWKSFTSTALVQGRVQEGWTEEEEAALASTDTAYAKLQSEIDALMAAPLPPKQPYRMALSDPELVDAGRDLNETVRNLDQRLRVDP